MPAVCKSNPIRHTRPGETPLEDLRVLFLTCYDRRHIYIYRRWRISQREFGPCRKFRRFLSVRGGKQEFSFKQKNRRELENKYRPNTQQEVFLLVFPFSTRIRILYLCLYILSLLPSRGEDQKAPIEMRGASKGRGYLKKRSAKDLLLSGEGNYWGDTIRDPGVC